MSVDRHEAAVRRLKRDISRMDKLVAKLPDYLDDLPAEARDEIVARISRLGPRVDQFATALARREARDE